MASRFSSASKGFSSLFHTPRARIWWAVAALAVLFVLSAGYAAPQQGNWVLDNIAWPWKKFPDTPYRLGLDLKGGTRLVYEADVSKVPGNEQSSALDGVRDVIERRVNAFGVAEPLIQTAKVGDHWRVIVELAGIQDINQAIKLIGETPLLEFKEQNPNPATELTEQQKKEIEQKNAEAKKRADEILKEALKPGADFTTVFEAKNEGIGVVTAKGDLGLVKEDNPQLGDLVKAIKSSPQKPPYIFPRVVETADAYNVVRVESVNNKVKEVRASHLLVCFEGKQRCESKSTRAEADKKIEELKSKATKDNFADLAKENSTDPTAKTNGGDLDFFGVGAMTKPFEDAAFEASVGSIVGPVETDFGFHLIYKTGERLVTSKTPEYHLYRITTRKTLKEDILGPQDDFQYTGLGGKQLEKAAVEFDPNTGEPTVSIQFDDEGGKLFSELTKRNIGKPIAIFLDGSPISVPRVQSQIDGGRAVITGSFTVPEAKLLAQRLNAGALPVPINLLNQQIVGASLGAESIAKSLKAGIYGVIAIILFMILLYRLPGVLASGALLLYTAVLLSVFKIAGITLTFAGIAGVLLSIGMAVDANILIFERMKEELRWGKPLTEALREGFGRAWTSIRDSNASSLITCVILYTFSSSNIKGFAITLALGIIVSLFSAITVTRTLLKWILPWVQRHHWMFARVNKPINQ
ncbi:protein translocase subunit SecD [Candidatus Uhrbacteria bacterium]|nr:protein translocase subunit SecD [Candidatus Uhrbacteria bacterium]